MNRQTHILDIVKYTQSRQHIRLMDFTPYCLTNCTVQIN